MMTSDRAEQGKAGQGRAGVQRAGQVAGRSTYRSRVGGGGARHAVTAADAGHGF